MIYETGAQGLVVAAMLERLGGKIIEFQGTGRVSYCNCLIVCIVI